MVSLLHLYAPFCRLIPEVEGPTNSLSASKRTIYTAAGLFFYLIACQIPLFGLNGSSRQDSNYWIRTLLASSRGSLMELGISPLITASWVMRFLQVLQLIPDITENEYRLKMGLQRSITMVICLTTVLGQIKYGYYDDVGGINLMLIVFQLMASTLFLILLDDMLSNGYGLGSGISLFICANVCENIVWNMFSPVTFNTKYGMQFQGSIVCLVHFLITKDTIYDALRSAFFRRSSNNLCQLCGQVIMFLFLVYLTNTRVMLRLRSKQRGEVKRVKIKLFYLSCTSIMINSIMISHLTKIIQQVCLRFSHLSLIRLLGVWNNNNTLINGLLWYITPPKGLQLIRLITYLTFNSVLCVQSAYLYMTVMELTAEDRALELIKQGYAMENEELSVYGEMKKTVPIAATLGAIIIVCMGVLGDVLGVSGSATGFIIAISVLANYYQEIG